MQARVNDTNINETNIYETNIKDTSINDTSLKEPNIREANIREINNVVGSFARLIFLRFHQGGPPQSEKVEPL